MQRWFGTALAVSILMIPAAALADGPDTYGFGGRNAALAGAMTAGSDDWAAAYYNPAGVAVPGHLKAGVGVVFGADQLQPFQDIVLGYDSTGAPIRGNVGASYEDVNAVVGGLSIPLTRKLSFGLALWAPLQQLIRIQAIDEFIPHYALYVDRAQRFHLDLCLGYRIGDSFRVGLGATTLSNNRLDTNFQIPAGAGSDANLSHAVILLDIVPTISPTAGAEWELGKSWFMGATYRGQTSLQTNVTQASGAQTVFQIGPSLRFRSSVDITGGFAYVDHFTPQELSVGVKREAPELPLAVYFDASWINWSAYQGPYIDPDFNPIVVPPLGTVPVNWRHPAGTNFRDTVVPRLGLEYRVSQVVALRAGYSYEMTPAPLASGEANVLDANSHILTAGAGFKFRDPLGYAKNPVKLNLHARLRELETTTATKAVTYNCNDSAQHPPVGYPCSGSITAGGQVVSGGLDFDFDF